jgi:hypothetical protein
MHDAKSAAWILPALPAPARPTLNVLSTTRLAFDPRRLLSDASTPAFGYCQLLFLMFLRVADGVLSAFMHE